MFNTGGLQEQSVALLHGVTFNGDTAAANALDDYEEGTWSRTASVQHLLVSASSNRKLY